MASHNLESGGLNDGRFLTGSEVIVRASTIGGVQRTYREVCNFDCYARVSIQSLRTLRDLAPCNSVDDGLHAVYYACGRNMSVPRFLQLGGSLRTKALLTEAYCGTVLFFFRVDITAYGCTCEEQRCVLTSVLRTIL